MGSHCKYQGVRISRHKTLFVHMALSIYMIKCRKSACNMKKKCIPNTLQCGEMRNSLSSEEKIRENSTDNGDPEVGHLATLNRSSIGK